MIWCQITTIFMVKLMVSGQTDLRLVILSEFTMNLLCKIPARMQYHHAMFVLRLWLMIVDYKPHLRRVNPHAHCSESHDMCTSINHEFTTTQNYQHHIQPMVIHNVLEYLTMI